MSSKTLIPLAEHFHSIQGEGLFTGTPMHFLRTSGCPVGAAATKAYIGQGQLATNQPLIPVLETGASASMCRTYDNRFFACDTDFRHIEKVSIWNLVVETYEAHICLTGGEPLAHQKSPWFEELFDYADNRGMTVHIETSGTILLNPWRTNAWLTVAPKYNYDYRMLALADEIKFLVDENFDIKHLPEHLDECKAQIFLCPINDEKAVNLRNVAICMNLLKDHPRWRLSAQWHKFLGVR